MKNEFTAVKHILKALGFYVGFFLIARLFFLFYFGTSEILEERLDEVIAAFVLGSRYDLIVLCYLFAPMLLAWLGLSLVSFKPFYYLYTLLSKVNFLIVGCIVIVIVAADYGFYSFFQDHINILFFGFFEDDTTAILESIWKDYPVLLLLIPIFLYFILIIFCSANFFKFGKRYKSLKLRYRSLLIFIVLILFFGGIRGGYGRMVLSPKYADFSDNEFINQLSRNSIIALEQTYQLRKMRSGINFNMADELGYKRIQDAFSDYLGIDLNHTPENDLVDLVWRKTPDNPELDNNKPHVIVILMESFSNFWLQYHGASFNLLGELEPLLKEGVYFPYTLPSDNGTIGSLMSLTTNIPHRRGARFLSESRYMNLPLGSASHMPYKNRGYMTNFFYGGKLSWRNIGRYLKQLKYDNVEGENGIKKQIKFEGSVGNEWGLFDEHLFSYVKEKLDNENPQFMFVLSTSNHPPFEVPENYNPLPLVLPNELEQRISRERGLFIERFRAFQYANQKVAEFINKVRKEHPQTVIALTGDHNFFGFLNYRLEEAFAKHTVPTLFLFPEDIKIKNVNTKKIASHDDIMTTLYNSTLSNTNYLSFGDDLFSSGSSYGFNSVVLAGEEGIHYRDKFYSWGEKPLVKPVAVEKLESLDKRYRSTVSVADFFLRISLDQRPADLEKGRPE